MSTLPTGVQLLNDPAFNKATACTDEERDTLGPKLTEQMILFLGAGEAGIGTADLIVDAMTSEGGSAADAHRGDPILLRLCGAQMCDPRYGCLGPRGMRHQQLVFSRRR